MITYTSPLHSRLLAYTKERFPLIPVLILVILMTSAAAHLLANWYGLPFSWQSTEHFGAIVTVFLFMLELRMADEIKDFDKDSIAYPDRMLSKGIVNLNNIRAVLFSVVAIQLIINFFLGIEHLVLLLILQGYAYLMAQEFFAKNFLEKRIGVYLISHQIILIPLMIYSALSFVPVSAFSEDLYVIYPLLYLCLPYTVYELSRKTWSKDRENIHADSYTRFWGINKTVVIEMLLVVAIGFVMNKMAMLLPFSHKILAGVLYVIYVVSLILFKKDPVKKKSKLVELGGSLLLLGLYALDSFLL